VAFPLCVSLTWRPCGVRLRHTEAALHGAYGYRFDGIKGLDWLIADGMQDWPVLQIAYVLEIASSEIFGTVPLQFPAQLDPSPITVFAPKHSGPAKVALYDDPLCFIEEFLAPEKAQGTLIVDRAMDSGSRLAINVRGPRPHCSQRSAGRCSRP
jgi:hypothetical protein